MGEPAFERFPLDGRLYQIVWSGRVCTPHPSIATPRVKLWLAEVTEGPNQASKLVCDKRGQLKLVTIDEAGGSTPKLAVGSFWRDQTMQHGHYFDHGIRTHTAVLPPQRFEIVRGNDRFPGDRSPRVDPEDHPMGGVDASGAWISFHAAPLVRCVTDNNSELLIPCYEVFRKFFAFTSELANAMLSGAWTEQVDTLVDPKLTGVSDDGRSFVVAPSVSMRDIACCAIAHFKQDKAAEREATGIYISIQNGRRAEISEPWIFVKPPDLAAPIKLRFLGKTLRSGATLVLSIEKLPFPRLPLPVVRLDPVRNVMVEDPTAPVRPPLATIEQQQSELDAVTIQPASDVRMRRSAIHLNVGDAWTGVPKIVHKVQDERLISYNPTTEGDPPPERQLRVATGKRSKDGLARPGSLSSDAQNEIIDRFRALYDCFVKLQQEQRLEWSDYAVVSPVVVGNISCCKFPTRVANVDRRWSTIGVESGRNRLCWVTELTTPDGELFYWFETEVDGTRGYKALLVKPRHIGLRLSSEIVDTILKIGAIYQGKWRSNPMRVVAEQADWRAITHRFESGSVRPSLVLGKLKSMSSLGRQLDE